jgi:hypothetical protein
VAIKNTPVTFGADFLLGNDVDPEGDVITITSIDKSMTQGSLSGSGPYTYTPPSDYTGSDSFKYTVSDPKGAAATATVSITVRLTNNGPTLNAISNQSNPEGAIVSVPTHATDPDGDWVIYSAANLPDGLKINRTTGEISGTIGYAASTHSPYTVQVTATEAGFNTDTKSFTWT